MADTSRVALNFDLGFQSDAARELLPQGAAYRMRDWIPELDVSLRGRGPWSYASQDLNALSAATFMSGVGWAPFNGDPHLVGFSEVGKAYRMTTFSPAAGSFIAATHGQRLTHRPVWHKDRLIIPGQLGGSAVSPYKYYDSGTLAYTAAALGGTPPFARVAASWGDYLILANGYDPSDSNKLKNNRMWFSGVGNPESWVLSGASASFIDAPREIVGIMPLRSVVLVWGYEDTWEYTGDTPPPGGNMARVNLFGSNGCMDSRSIVNYREYAIWANNSGVWKSDGSTLTELTKGGQIKNYYRSVVGGFSFAQGWSAAGGVYQGFYFLTIRDGTGNLVTTLVCDVDRQVWFEVQNINATMYAERPSSPGTTIADGHEELFFAHASAARLGYSSSIWTPGSPGTDADGRAILPVLETPYYILGTDALKRFRRVYLNYDVRSAGGTPGFQVDYLLDPQGSYESLGVLATTTTRKHSPLAINDRGYGVGFRIMQTQPSSFSALASIDLEGHAYEGSRS